MVNSLGFDGLVGGQEAVIHLQRQGGQRGGINLAVDAFAAELARDAIAGERVAGGGPTAIGALVADQRGREFVVPR